MLTLKDTFMKKITGVLLFIFSVFSVGAQTTFTNGDSLLTQGVPVVFKSETLFTIFTAPKGFSANERALLIENRLNKITEQNSSFQEKDLVIKDTAGAYVIFYKDLLLMGVTEADALANKTDAKLLANEYRKIITEKLLQVFAFDRPEVIALSVGQALATILILILFIWLINYLFKLLLHKYLLKKTYTSFYFRKYELLTAHQLKSFFYRLAINIKWLFIILMIYASLPVLFSLFPWTKNIAHHLISFTIKPIVSIYNSIIDYIPNLFTITIIYIFTRQIIRIIRYFAGEIEKGKLSLPGFYKDWANPTYNIIKSILYIFMFITIFPYLPGSDSKIFQGVSVLLGILISVGSSSAISNVVSGVVITYMRPFKVGDRVKIGDVTGDVITKNLLITRIRTIKNEDITIPNSTILSGGTVNYSACALEKGLILNTTISLGYDTPWKLVEEVLVKAAKATPDILKEPSPFVLQTSLDDSYVSYQLNAYTRKSNEMANIYSALHQHIQDECNKAGIEIMSPTYHSIRDGNKSTIPEK